MIIYTKFHSTNRFYVITNHTLKLLTLTLQCWNVTTFPERLANSAETPSSLISSFLKQNRFKFSPLTISSSPFLPYTDSPIRAASSSLRNSIFISLSQIKITNACHSSTIIIFLQFSSRDRVLFVFKSHQVVNINSTMSFGVTT